MNLSRTPLAARWPAAALAVVVTGATALSLYWVFLVPIFESPDEQVLADYAFSLYRAGHLITVRDGSLGSGHPYTPWLITASGAERVIKHPDVKAPPGYGSADYYRQVDAGAPPLDVPPRDIPYLVDRYPFGYFALAALWLAGLAPLLGSGPVALFFLGRAFNTFLLAVGLVAGYGLLRRMGFRPARALLVTASIGFFPLVTFVTSYIQADNLGFALVPVSLYAGIRLAACPDWRPALGLGAALALLLVTKYQFFLCTALPLAGLLATRLPRSRRCLPLLPALLLPAVGLAALQAWIVWGSANPLVFHGRVTPGLWSDFEFRQAVAGGPASLAGFLLGGLAGALRDFFWGGSVFQSFWGVFGWQDTTLQISSPRVAAAVGLAIQAGVLAVAALSVWRAGTVATRLIRLARRGRGRSALRLLFANPAINALVLFELFMVGFYVYTSDTFFAQGRNWLPFMLPIVLLGVWYAPSALPRGRPRRLAGGAALAAWLAYSAVGSYYAIPALKERFYGDGRTAGPAAPASTAPAGDFQYSVDLVDSSPPVNPAAFPHWYQVTTVGVSGWAADVGARRAAAGVTVTVDGGREYPAVYGDSRPDVAAALGDGAYLRTGFDVVLQLRDVAPGPHYLTVRIISADGNSSWEPPVRYDFEIPRPPASGAADARGLIRS